MATARRYRILIVDDDERHLKAVRTILEMEGYEVHTQNQPIGTSKVAISLAPDLILLDINMPGISGDRLASILLNNEITRKIPVLFYSGNDPAKLQELVRQYGVAGYIRKGDPAALRQRVASALEGSLRQASCPESGVPPRPK